jgi:signal transduction histidine kinase
MSKSVERYGNELRALRNYAETLGYACTVEQVYAFGLNVLMELFDPDTAFVVLSESSSSKQIVIPPLRPGMLTEVVFPIRAGEKVTGRFILQYKNPSVFREADVLFIEMISLHAGAIIHQLHRQQQKDEVIAMAVHELRSPLAGILGGAFMRLWQIFSNLLSNAIRFAPNGEVRIGSAVEDGMVKITVVDNGAGIPREHLPYILERFRQGKSAKLQPHDGLGRGLSIVKNLVTMDGGTVTAGSDGLGKGANFVVSLPSA